MSRRLEIVAGLDEAGRGPLAGPVVAAAVVLSKSRRINGLADSKALNPARREVLYERVVRRAGAWSVAWCDPAEIDAVNILQATMLAMRRALLGLRVVPTRALIDGNRLPELEFFGQRVIGNSVVKGDAKVPAISAASIVAKVTRDRLMRHTDTRYPQYGFAQHKGYCTRRHLLALEQNGPCVEHRQSFKPVSDQLDIAVREPDGPRKSPRVRVTISSGRASNRDRCGAAAQ